MRKFLVLCAFCAMKLCYAPFWHGRTGASAQPVSVFRVPPSRGSRLLSPFRTRSGYFAGASGPSVPSAISSKLYWGKTFQKVEMAPAAGSKLMASFYATKMRKPKGQRMTFLAGDKWVPGVRKKYGDYYMKQGPLWRYVGSEGLTVVEEGISKHPLLYESKLPIQGLIHPDDPEHLLLLRPVTLEWVDRGSPLLLNPTVGMEAKYKLPFLQPPGGGEEAQRIWVQ